MLFQLIIIGSEVRETGAISTDGPSQMVELAVLVFQVLMITLFLQTTHSLRLIRRLL